MNVFFYFTQSSEPLHNAIIVSYTAVFSIGLRKRVRKLGKRTLFSRIPEEKLSMLSVYAKLIHTHDPVGRKCCLYRDILMQKKKKWKKERNDSSGEVSCVFTEYLFKQIIIMSMPSYKLQPCP